MLTIISSLSSVSGNNNLKFTTISDCLICQKVEHAQLDNEDGSSDDRVAYHH